MTSQKFTIAPASRNLVAILVASSVLFAAGCANMETTATSTPLSASAALSGKVHGGNNAVAGATVLLMSPGQTGLGSTPFLYAQTTTSSDGGGNFHFTKNAGNIAPANLPANPGSSYQCPTGSDVMMYLYAYGGNTTGNLAIRTNNAAAAFLAPVGFCSQIGAATFVDVSEVTTAATVAALAQFINPNNDNIGTDGIGVGYQAVNNAFLTVPNMVNQASGIATTSSTITGLGSGVNVSGVTVTVTSPTTTINTIANILSTCVNQATASSGSNCSSLFSNAVPPTNAARESQPSLTYNAAADTIQAALYMYLNPTDSTLAHRMALFNQAPASSAPFLPALGQVPGDWLLPLVYTSTSTCGATGSTFFSYPDDLNIDYNGNLWIANKAGATSGANNNGALVGISPYGLANTCISLGGSALGGGVVDTTGSIWYADNANSKIYAYSPPPVSNALRTFATAAPPVAIMPDGNGNIFFSTTNGTTGSVYEIQNATSPSNVSSPVLITNTVGPNPARMFPDTAQDVWVSSGSTFVTELQFTTAVGNVHGYVPAQFTVTGPTYGIQVGPANKVYVTSQDVNSTFTILTPTNTSAYNVSFTSGAQAGGMSTPTGFWLDGSQSSWVANDTAETSGFYAISQIGPDAGSLSPSGTNGGYQKPANAISGGRLSVVDPIGNVWVMSDNLPNTLTEIVGAAVPIYAPYANGIPNGRFQTIP